ncbi:hypothetical protein Tco_0111421 [Tanacetum coccineum]
MISTGSSTKLSLSSSRSSFVRMTRDSSDRHFFRLETSNVSRVKLSSFSELDDTFKSLQALSNLEYLLSGFMDYFLSRKLDISNFGPANRYLLRHLPFQDGSKFHNYNLQAILANDVDSCSTLSDQGYAKDFYDQ